MGYKYGIVGSGRQGIGAAYDLLVRGEADRVVLADRDPETAQAAAGLITELGPHFVVADAVVDAEDEAAVTEWMHPFDVVLGAATWRLNVGLTRAAIAAGTHFVDLGGNTDVVLAQLAMNETAQRAGIAVVPDCGQVPGTGANLMAYVARSFDAADSVTLYDGGIPAAPEPPWNYQLTFNMDGLTNEYWGHALYIIDGEQQPVEVFADDEYELINVPGFGTLEAFPTSGGLTTLSQTLAGQIRNLKNKTLRYPGHVAQFKAFRDAGFFAEDAIEVDGQRVVPRSVFHALIEPQIRAPEDFEDAIVNRVVGTGRINDEDHEITLDVIMRRPTGLPFTAMQAATGWHAAIIMHRIAGGNCAPGVHAVENAISGTELLSKLEARGFSITENRIKVG